MLVFRNLQNSLESQRFEGLHMEKKSLHMAELGLHGAKLGLHIVYSGGESGLNWVCTLFVHHHNIVSTQFK